MKQLLLNNSIVDMWKDAVESKNPLYYLMAFWATSLMLIASTSWLYLVTRFIMNPSMFDNVTWGLIDYIP